MLGELETLPAAAPSMKPQDRGQGGDEPVRCGSWRKTKSRTGIFSPFCDLQSVSRPKMCPKTDGPNLSKGTKQRFRLGIITELPLPVFRQCSAHHTVASRAHLQGIEREGSQKNEKTEKSFCISDPIVPPLPSPAPKSGRVAH